MSEDSPRWRKADCPEHSRPVDRVGHEDVLAYQVGGGRPQAAERPVVRLEACCGQVVDEGVEPHVCDIVSVEWEPDTPVQSLDRPRDAEVAKGPSQESEYLVQAVRRLHELWVVAEVAHQPVLILPHAEEVVALSDSLNRPPAIRAATIGRGPSPSRTAHRARNTSPRTRRSRYLPCPTDIEALTPRGECVVSPWCG